MSDAALAGQGRFGTLATHPLAWGLAITLAVAVTQTGGILREIWNWDEATFILMAESLRDGHLPYVALFDNKPPAMFFLLAGWMGLFGESLWAVRLLGDVAVLASSLLVFALARPWAGTVPAGLAGLLSVAVHTTWLGQYTSTELPATAFLMGALWTFTRHPDRVRAAALAGLLISLATLTRSNLGLVAVVFGLWLAAAALIGGHARRGWAMLAAYAGAGLAPVAVLLALYGAAGQLDALWVAVVEVPASYAESQSVAVAVAHHGAELWAQITGYPQMFAAFVLVGLLGMALSLTPRPHAGPAPWPGRDRGLLWTMTGTVLASIALSGASYPHYWLQLVPFLCLFAARALAAFRMRTLPGLAVLGLAALPMLDALRISAPDFVTVAASGGVPDDRHQIRAAAAAIDAVRGPEDTVWATSRHLILWYLDLDPIDRVAAHPDNVSRTEILAPLVAAGYSAPDVLERIYASRPAFVVAGGAPAPPYIEDTAAWDRFLSGYDVFHESPGLVVFRRRE